MSLRETLNKNPAIIAGVVVVAIAACGWVVWSQMGSSSKSSAPDSVYYTVDEGQTLFADSPTLLTPFDKDGKPAVRAYVYKCADGTQTVAYLERYTEKGKAVMEKFRAEKKANPGVPPPSVGELSALGRAAKEVKRPGDKQWTNSATGAERGLVESLKCKDGQAPVVANP